MKNEDAKKFAAVICACVALSAAGSPHGRQTPTARWFVLNAAPGSVVSVDPVTFATVGKVDLACGPSYLLRAQSPARLYVLCNGALDVDGKRLERDSELLVIDEADLSVKAKIPVGWRVHKMLLSNDERHVVTLSARKAAVNKTKQPELPPTAHVISTSTASVVATLAGPALGNSEIEWLFGTEGSDLLITKDFSRLFIVDQGRVDLKGERKLEIRPSVSVFEPLTGSAIAVTPLDEHATTLDRHRDLDGRPHWALSSDEATVFFVERGYADQKDKRLSDGAVLQLDARTGQVVKKHPMGFFPVKPYADPLTGAVVVASDQSQAKGSGIVRVFRGAEVLSHEIGGLPQFIGRYEGLPAIVVGSVSSLTLIPDDGGPVKSIELRPKSGPSLGSTHYPSPHIIVLPQLNRLILGLDWQDKKDAFWPELHLAVLDLARTEPVKVPGLVPKGPSFLSQMLGAALQGALIGGVTAAMNVPMPATFPMFSAKVASIRGRPGHFTVTPDGAKVIMLGASARALQVVDPAGSVTEKALALGGDSYYQLVHPRGRPQLALISPNKVTFFDIQKETLSGWDLKGQKVVSASADDTRGEVVVITTRSIIFFSADDGKIRGRIDALQEPRLLVRNH